MGRRGEGVEFIGVGRRGKLLVQFICTKGREGALCEGIERHS